MFTTPWTEGTLYKVCKWFKLSVSRLLFCHQTQRCNDQFAQATLLIRQPEAILIKVRLIVTLSSSPEGKVTVAVALPFLICGVLTLKFCSQPVSQSCAQMNISASMRRMSLGAFA